MKSGLWCTDGDREWGMRVVAATARELPINIQSSTIAGASVNNSWFAQLWAVRG